MTEKSKIVGEFTLFDDEHTRKKSTCMDRWDIVCDDYRNDQINTDGSPVGLYDFLEWGKKYRITIEEVS